MDRDTLTGETKALKKQMRREVMEQIAALEPAYTKAADEQILRYLLSLPAYWEASTVFCFVGSDTEINTTPFLENVLRDGKTLAVPLCLKRGIMEGRRIRSLDELSTGSYGLLEPSPDSEVVEPDQIGLAVIPCVSCGHDGKRLGHGGGFYDIYFSAHPRIPTVMICRERITREDIPTEAHDLRFPTVITEKGIYTV